MADGRRLPEAPDGHTVRVFFEVANPGTTSLSLARMTYELRAESWLSGPGEIALARSLPAQSSTVIEVPLTLTRAQALGPARSASPSSGGYTLEARLYTRGDRLARSWRIRASGKLPETGVARALRAPMVPIRVAEIGP